MAAKVDAEEQTNTIDPARLKKELARIEEAIAAKESHRMGYVEKCKPFNERVANAYEIASKAAGVPMNVLKAKVKERELHRKIVRIGERLEDDARETFEMVSQALGDFGTLPLGQAAKDRAARAEKSDDAEAPKRPRGRPRKTQSDAETAIDDTIPETQAAEVETSAGEDSEVFKAGYDARVAGSGCAIPNDLEGDDRDLWHNGWLKADAALAGEKARENSDRLKAGISPLH